MTDYKPAVLRAFYEEGKTAMMEESTTQRKVVESYNMRKIENVSAGYYMMLEKGNRKKRIALAAKKKRMLGMITD